MKPFEITSPRAVHCGAGEFHKTAGKAARLARRVIIVTGSHLHGSQLTAALQADLQRLGAEAWVAPPVTGEPTVEMVDELAAFIRDNSADGVVAIGGGSVMDTAKAAAVMARNVGITEDYQLKRREIENPPIAQIFVPTTAGTGSETTRVSVLTNNRVGVKRSISHPWMTPDVVVLDPELTLSLSPYFTTTTAMDAFAHAIESAVSRDSHPYTRHIALAGIEELSKGLPGALENPHDLDARLHCLIGSSYAGLAMQAGLGASHSLAPAVCIVSGARHSEAVAALLTTVIRVNERHSPGVYDEVKQAMGVEDVAARLEEWRYLGGLCTGLLQFGLTMSEWPEVRKAMERYASHRGTNPVDVTDEYAAELYERSL